MSRDVPIWMPSVVLNISHLVRLLMAVDAAAVTVAPASVSGCCCCNNNARGAEVTSSVAAIIMRVRPR
jgi:hypothetical protein